MATYSGISKFSAFDPETGDFIQLNMLSNQSNFEHTLIEDEETTGGGFAGANYRLEIIAGDVTPEMLELFEEWQELKTPLEFFGYGPDFFLQWLQRRTLSIAPVDPANATGGRRKYRILVDFSGITSGIRWGANLLHLQNPWKESVSNPGNPDGYLTSNVSNPSFINGEYSFETGTQNGGITINWLRYVLFAQITVSISTENSESYTISANRKPTPNSFTTGDGFFSDELVGDRIKFNFLITPPPSGLYYGLRLNFRVQMNAQATISNPAIRAGKNHRYIEE